MLDWRTTSPRSSAHRPVPASSPHPAAGSHHPLSRLQRDRQPALTPVLRFPREQCARPVERRQPGAWIRWPPMVGHAVVPSRAMRMVPFSSSGRTGAAAGQDPARLPAMPPAWLPCPRQWEKPRLQCARRGGRRHPAVVKRPPSGPLCPIVNEAPCCRHAGDWFLRPSAVVQRWPATAGSAGERHHRCAAASCSTDQPPCNRQSAARRAAPTTAANTLGHRDCGGSSSSSRNVLAAAEKGRER